MAKATLDQIGELIAQVKAGRIDKATLQKFLDNPSGIPKNEAKQDAVPFVAPELKTWKTIKVGTGIKTAEDFLKAMKDAGHEIGDWAKDIMEKPTFTVSAEETELNLVVVSVAELGFPDGATRKQIYDRALSIMELCPPEVGPQLRLQYTDQLKGEWLLVGMDPITGSYGDLYVFYVGRDGGGGSWLHGSDGGPDFQWSGDNQWVFVRRN